MNTDTPSYTQRDPAKKLQGAEKEEVFGRLSRSEAPISSFVYSVVVIHGLEADATLKCLIRLHEDKWWQT